MVYPDVEFKEVSNKYGTCADDFKTGFEIWNKGDLLAFAITDKDDKDRILNLIILSSKINFNNINTSLKLEEVLKLYPKSTLEEDSLSEWEYVYIHELKIKVVFQTDETNQIGRYDQDGKLIQLKRKNVKIDFIEF